jgi:hypothetical protein
MAVVRLGANMAISYLGICGAGLNFAGGAFLVYEALRLPRKVLAAYGARAAAEDEAQKTGKPARYVDDKGKPLKNLLDWEIWMSKKVQYRNWFGFSLVTVGFLLDLLSRIFEGAGQ